MLLRYACVVLATWTAIIFVKGTREHDLNIELENGTSWSVIYQGKEFPDIQTIFSIGPSQIVKVAITLSNIESIDGSHLSSLNNLKSLTLNGNKNLRKLGDTLFINNTRLVEINLNNNNLESISLKTFNGVFRNGGLVGVLFLSGNRLRRFPPFVTTAPGLKEIHLDGNPIIGISQAELKNLEQLHKISLRQTKLLEIVDFTFSKNPHLGQIDLSENPGLVTVSNAAFEGATELKSLNLSKTGISFVPHKGLNNLEILSLKDTNGIWTIANEIVQLPKLRYVEVPSSRRFLCCAFIYERKQVGHFGFGRGSNRTRNCSTATPSTTSAATRQTTPVSPTTGKLPATASGRRGISTPAITGGFWMARKKSGRKLLWFREQAGFMTTNTTSSTRKSRMSYVDDDGISDDFGTHGFLTATVVPHSVLYHCDNVTGALQSFERTYVTCVPGPDALRPCDDIMGNTFLSATSWIISLLALLSNAVVFAVLLLSRRHFTVTKFLITNLAFADMCLGLYLLIMICASTHTHGSYYNYVRSWQFGAGCKVAGFLAIFSSQLSMLVLTVITIERYLAIVYAVYLNKRLHMRNARILCIGSWLASALMALLPLVGVNSYDQVALCLPFETKTVLDITFIAFMLTFNTVLCAVVFLAYFRMYWVVRSPQTDSSSQSRNDSAIAKRMALLVFTDFACWTPIAVIGLFSAAGYSKYIGMDVKKSKYLLVIFFPINSICNPFLYALSTKSFRRELVFLLASCGICRNWVTEYTAGASFSRRSRHHRDTRHSDTQSTYVSRKDSRIVSLKSFFRRTLLPEKLQNGNQGSPKQCNNQYPMSRYNDDDPNRTVSPLSDVLINCSKEGSVSEALNNNGGLRSQRSSRNSGNSVFSPDSCEQSCSISPCGHLSAKSTSYNRTDSAMSNGSAASGLDEEAVLVKQKSKDDSQPAPRKGILKDHRL